MPLDTMSKSQIEELTTSQLDALLSALLDPANPARVHPDAPRLVGQQLYAALVADPAARQALGSARSLAVALGRALDVRLRFGTAATALAALPRKTRSCGCSVRVAALMNNTLRQRCGRLVPTGSPCSRTTEMLVVFLARFCRRDNQDCSLDPSHLYLFLYHFIDRRMAVIVLE